MTNRNKECLIRVGPFGCRIKSVPSRPQFKKLLELVFFFLAENIFIGASDRTQTHNKLAIVKLRVIVKLIFVWIKVLQMRFLIYWIEPYFHKPYIIWVIPGIFKSMMVGNDFVSNDFATTTAKKLKKRKVFDDLMILLNELL